MASYISDIENIITRYYLDLEDLKEAIRKLDNLNSAAQTNYDRDLRTVKADADEVCSSIADAYTQLSAKNVPSIWMSCVKNDSLDLDSYVSSKYKKTPLSEKEPTRLYDLFLNEVSKITN